MIKSRCRGTGFQNFECRGTMIFYILKYWCRGTVNLKLLVPRHSGLKIVVPRYSNSEIHVPRHHGMCFFDTVLIFLHLHYISGSNLLTFIFQNNRTSFYNPPLVSKFSISVKKMSGVMTERRNLTKLVKNKIWFKTSDVSVNLLYMKIQYK